MNEDIISLSGDFPNGDEAQWRSLVEKALKGGAPEKLDSTTYDGIKIKGLFRDSDWSSSKDVSGFPGDAPFIRGGETSKDAFLPWDIRQNISFPDPAQANKDILKDLEGGVSSIELRIDEDGGRGVCIRTIKDIAVTLEDVNLELASVGLDTTGASAAHSMEAAALFASYVQSQKVNTSDLALAFNIDPIGTLARTGSLPHTAENAVNEAVEASKFLNADFASSTILRADSRPAHESGASEAQELAFAAAAGAQYMRALVSAGVAPDAANKMILFTVSVSADYLLEMSKLRALRRIWTRIATAFGVSDSNASLKLQAVSSRRMLTARDPWVNMLRNTAACFAAGVGGADIVTVRPFTDALGLPSKLGRRIARNTQIIAQEESSLGKVLDPAGGAWSIGKLSDEMALKAWDIFQDIEAQGGLTASLVSGHIQEQIAKVRAQRKRNVAFRKEPVTGVSDFPLLDENEPEIVLVDLDKIRASAASPTGTTPKARDMASLMETAKSGASLEDLCVDAEGAESDPLWPIRLAKPFELLRDHADAFEKKTGQRPQVLLAALGPLAEHTARTTFASNFFAAGGVQSKIVTGTPEDIGRKFAGSGCTIACICGTDGRYELEAADTARELGAAGVGRLYLAGKPNDHEQDWREAGVDEYIHIGVDVISSLELAHTELGLTL